MHVKVTNTENPLPGTVTEALSMKGGNLLQKQSPPAGRLLA